MVVVGLVGLVVLVVLVIILIIITLVDCCCHCRNIIILGLFKSTLSRANHFPHLANSSGWDHGIHPIEWLQLLSLWPLESSFGRSDYSDLTRDPKRFFREFRLVKY